MTDPHQYPNIETAERIELTKLKAAIFEVAQVALTVYQELDSTPGRVDYRAIRKYFDEKASDVSEHCGSLAAYDHVRHPAPPPAPDPVLQEQKRALAERVERAADQTAADFRLQRTLRRDGAP